MERGHLSVCLCGGVSKIIGRHFLVRRLDSHFDKFCDWLTLRRTCLQGDGASFRVLMAVIEALGKHSDAGGKGGPCMTGVGMWVRRDRRRRGIGEAIVRGVVASCPGKGVPNFSAFYSGTGSQRAAAKAGLKVGVWGRV